MIDIRELPGTSQTTVVEGQGFFPVIAALDERELLVVLRGGAGHVGLAGRLDVVRSTDGGETWGTPQTVADSERDDRNPALGVARAGTVVLAYHWQGSYDAAGRWDSRLDRADTRVTRSTDGGRTWIGDALINFTALNGASPFGKIRDVDGVLHMPIYTGPVVGDKERGEGPWIPPPVGPPVRERERALRVDPATCPTYLLRSTDDGRTWGDPTLVAMGLNEADFLVLPDGDWIFAGRSERAEEQAIHLCRSSDGGRSWRWAGRITEPSEHPPDLTLLGNGWVLLCFGHRHVPFGVQGVISKDGGRTWEPQRLLLADGFPGSDSGYPSTTRLPSGRLVTVYYSAGLHGQPHDSYSERGACCRAICWDEEALIRAVGE